MAITNNGGEWKLWEQRKNGLVRMIETLEGQLKPLDADFSRKDTLKVLLSKLREFAGSQFTFLFEGLNPDNGNPRLKTSNDRYPSEFVLEATLNQIGLDLAVLQGAIYQRRLAEQNTAVARTLDIADRLAYCALLPALKGGLLPFAESQVTVLTYFQLAPHIRVIPYAPVALVGIPFTTLATYQKGAALQEEGSARDLLSIPHEIGHYVYQHGTWDKPNVELPRGPEPGDYDMLVSWEQEIFADVYGVLVAGPAIVRDFQDIMRDNDKKSLETDDKRHPIPAVRPLLYVDTLRFLAEKQDAGKKEAFKDIADEAEVRWTVYLGNRGNKEIDRKRGVVERAAKYVFDFLMDEEKPLSIDERWSAPDDGQYEALYQDFYNAVASDALGCLTQDDPPELDPDWRSPVETVPQLQKANEIRKELATRPGGASLAEEDWIQVATMSGWTTEGPEPNPSPKVI